MTEEIKTDVVEQVVDQVVELSPIEQSAIEDGWQTKDDWVKAGKSEDDWRPAKEFKERGELFRKIENLATELKTTRSTMAALKGHYEKVKETEFKRALDTLKQEKKAALDAGDSDAVIELDDRIAEVRETQKAAAAIEKPVQEVNPEFTKWTQRNSWYTQDQELTQYADRMGRAFAVANPGIDPKEVLDYVTDVVKSKFPTKFTNPRRTAPSSVEGTAPANKTKGTTFELTEDETKVMNKLVNQKVMTKEKYIESIKNIRGKS